jgi:hypothetical protein
MIHKMRSVFIVYLLALSFNIYSQCLAGDCISGEGQKKYRNGAIYKGTFQNGVFHGQGELILPSKDHYMGSFANGKRHGKGKYTFAAGHVYQGDFLFDQRSGNGLMQYNNGDNYDGSWLHDAEQGEGTYTFRNGSQFRGSFVNGKFDGIGLFIETNKNSYTGIWKNNILIKKTSQVSTPTLTNNNRKNKEQIVSTSNVNNPPNTTNPQRLKDCTDQYCHNEVGKFSYRDGSYYIGPFINGKADGIGEVYYQNGDYYKGGWRNHAPNGKGIMRIKDGTVHAGIWEGAQLLKRMHEEESMARMEANPNKPKTKAYNESVDIYAVIIGVASYHHMNSLRYTDDDAYHLYAFLKSPEGGAIPDDQIALLIDDAASKKSIFTEISKTFAKADANDVVLLYMSGHGLEGSFVPYDYDGKNNLVQYDDVLNLLNASPAKHKLFIADACHSGSMYAAKLPMSKPVQDYYSKINKSNGGMAVITSSKTDEVSLEYSGVRHGVFSYYLIQGLKGDANKNNDAYVTIDELFNYIYTNVRHHTGNTQTPSIHGNYDVTMPVALVN